jgi:cobalt-zinc-cadmium efflux system protein
VDILLEAAPGHIEIADVKAAMREVEGVDFVHDVHVWTITSGFVAMSGHAVVEDGTDRQAAQRILQEMRDRLRDRFDIEHTTIQIEYEDLQAET